jgi:hypothetical protein
MGDETLWTFDRFAPGQPFGTVEIHTGGAVRARWEAVFGPAPDRLPRGMLVTAMMEAYIRAIQPRPDGNVHASQELAFAGPRPDWGNVVAVDVFVRDKEQKKGRNWVRFGIVARVGKRTVMTGTIRAIWAA